MRKIFNFIISIQLKQRAQPFFTIIRKDLLTIHRLESGMILLIQYCINYSVVSKILNDRILKLHFSCLKISFSLLKKIKCYYLNHDRRKVIYYFKFWRNLLKLYRYRKVFISFTIFIYSELFIKIVIPNFCTTFFSICHQVERLHFMHAQ